MVAFLIIPYVLFLIVCAIFGLRISTMLKRLSSTLKRGKSNGETMQNGVPGASGHGTQKMSPGSRNNDKDDREKPDQSANRSEVESTFEQYAQLIHAAGRPLPTQSGDGSYLEHDVPTGLLEDLKTLGFKDVGTLLNVMKTKQSGELADDKTYLMERVIQVRCPFLCLVILGS